MKDDAHKIIGKTRRGALAFDVADQNRDSQLLPWAYTDQKALDFMLDQIKPIAMRRKSTLISAINAKNMLADAENTTHYIRRYCGE
ncbi:MAG: hypothetical protein RQ936_12315 [Gammaproteobacteria bacterium]|nr:hypothetical protein [Gammaproteobacteria bacterium]